MNYGSLTDRELVSWCQSHSLMVEPLFAELVERLEQMVGEPTVEDELEAAEDEIQRLEQDVEDYKNSLESLQTDLESLAARVGKVVYDGPPSADACAAPGALS
jgi:predicted RNase H-like nuclease (RuvC/YqgF family)